MCLRVMQSLSDAEREYFHSLKRTQKNDITKRLKKCAKTSSDIIPLRMAIMQSNLPDEVCNKLFADLMWPKHEKYVAWVRKAINLPLGVVRTVPKKAMAPRIQAATDAMERRVTGFEACKREVLKMVIQEETTTASPIVLGLEGPPGVGKTHFVKNAMAEALGVPMISIQLGGAADLCTLLGMHYTYEGSKEGRIAAGLIEAKCMNPIFFFDELDKVSDTPRGHEVIDALIHIIDPVANDAIRDRYFEEIPLDLRRCTFVFSFNDPKRISPVLLDRMKRMKVHVPSFADKMSIVRKHILPTVNVQFNTDVVIEDDAIVQVLRKHSTEEGMRNIERSIRHIVSEAHLVNLQEVRIQTPLVIDGAFAKQCLTSSNQEDHNTRVMHSMYC